MRYGFIYETTNLLNGMKYVGSHSRTMKDLQDPDDSWYLGSGIYFLHALEMYGKENFSRVILFEADSEEELSELETNYLVSIDAANNPNYYNLTNSGYNKGSLGRKCDEETKYRMSLNNYVRINGRTEESRKKQSFTLKENNHQEILAERVKGTVWINDGVSCRRVPKDIVQDYLEDPRWKRGFISSRQYGKVSEETRCKMSEGRKATAASPESRKFYATMNNDPRRNPKGKIWISREGIKKLIYPADLEEYIAAGWNKGMKS